MVLETKLEYCHNFMVVIDTNCFENYSKNKKISPYCARTECDTFFVEKRARHGITMGYYYITESVFNEIIQQRKEYFVEARKKLEDAIVPFNISIEIPDKFNFEEDLRLYLKENRIKILPNPDNSIFPRIIDRSIHKKIPFKQIDKVSDKGFKDVLLWETLLSYDYESKHIGKVFLITANLKDFPINELKPEWKEFHPCIELSILQSWKDFENYEQIIFPEMMAQNNIDYTNLLEMFKNENPNIIELPNYKKKITGRKDSFVVEVETDIREKDGKIYSGTYFYDIRVNEPTLIDPDEYDKSQEVDNGTMEED